MIYPPSSQKLTTVSLVSGILLCALSPSAGAQTLHVESQTPSTSDTITGRVVTASGQPLPNALVSLRGSQPLFQPRVTTTDNEGNFQVTGLDPVLYGISATSPAYVTPPRDPDSQPNYYRVGDSVTVNLVKGAVITGAVQSAAGEPIVQILVRAVMVRDGNGVVPRYTSFQVQRLTDDRGLYRIYGLLPGTYVVSAGSRGIFTGSVDPYETDAPTYAPSSTRDTATEVTLRAGEETGGVDIGYRGEPGRSVSGFVSGLETNSNAASNVTLFQVSNGVRVSGGSSFQQPGVRGFAFYGVGEGDYELVAQASRGPGEVSLSEPIRIKVKSTDFTGLELVLKPLASIVGRVALEKSEAPECKNKRQPLFSETLLDARRSEKDVRADQPRLMSFFIAQGAPTKDGEFQLRNLAPGQYKLGARFFARYWFLRSIIRDMPLAAPASNKKTGTVKRQIDLAREGLMLKFGERQSNIIFTLTEGAASLRGKIKVTDGEAIPAKLYVHLIPAEKDNSDDVLRFFASEVQSDGTFTLGNLPPGRYWTIARIAAANEPLLETVVRAPEEKELRIRLRRAGEAAKTIVEFKPCQNVSDYSFTESSLSGTP